MKSKILKIIIIVLIVLVGLYFYFFRTIKIKENSNFRKIYSKNDYSDVQIELSYIGDISSEDTKKVLDILKEQKIKMAIRELVQDYIPAGGDMYHLVIKQGEKSFDVDIQGAYIVIGNTFYWTEDNIVFSLMEILGTEQFDINEQKRQEYFDNLNHFNN